MGRTGLPLNRVHAGRAGALAQALLKAFEPIRRTLGQYFDRALAAVANPAGKAQPPGFRLREITVSHALHAPGNPEVTDWIRRRRHDEKFSRWKE